MSVASILDPYPLPMPPKTLPTTSQLTFAVLCCAALTSVYRIPHFVVCYYYSWYSIVIAYRFHQLLPKWNGNALFCTSPTATAAHLTCSSYPRDVCRHPSRPPALVHASHPLQQLSRVANPQHPDTKQPRKTTKNSVSSGRHGIYPNLFFHSYTCTDRQMQMATYVRLYLVAVQRSTTPRRHDKSVRM